MNVIIHEARRLASDLLWHASEAVSGVSVAVRGAADTLADKLQTLSVAVDPGNPCPKCGTKTASNVGCVKCAIEGIMKRAGVTAHLR